MSGPESAPPPSDPAPQPADYHRAIHNLALSLAIVCPAIIALPPRRFDLMTAVLGGTTLVSLDQLHRDSFGYSVPARLGMRRAGPAAAAAIGDAQDGKAGAVRWGPGAELPTERAREVHERFRRVREEGMSVVEREERAKAERGLAQKVWYGEEGEGWRERREREDREKFEEGKGVGDIIMDQIWEVWNWGQPKDGEDGKGGE
ncbi:hypothetical protein CAC42_2454 [Sphaceloma murrayae]|uniref:Uncharacterized protein n=1 Tax=Sphaceloma murrayae TaxID=2082308 RepID=A0A2K1QW42_9PEZI|nr:hypothetical protein CAC42_2454 [Sphaceloma murrayae]